MIVFDRLSPLLPASPAMLPNVLFLLKSNYFPCKALHLQNKQTNSELLANGDLKENNLMNLFSYPAQTSVMSSSMCLEMKTKETIQKDLDSKLNDLFQPLALCHATRLPSLQHLSLVSNWQKSRKQCGHYANTAIICNL